MCGIFGYLFFNTSRSRQYVSNILVNGLKRLEYRGFDSSGIAIDSNTSSNEAICIKALGNVDCLKAEVEKVIASYDNSTYSNRSGIAHTRWATHGIPAVRNSHPHTSGSENEFLVVHNGMITNYKALKQMLQNHGFVFESDTDTEVVPKLAKLMHEKLSKKDKNVSFREVVLEVLKMLEGSYALIFKSKFYPGQLIAARNGSPLILGIKSETNSNQVASIFDARRRSVTAIQNLSVGIEENSEKVEYFLSSDASAIIEHTNKVFYFEDGEICHISESGFKVYQMPREMLSSNDSETICLTNEEIKRYSSKLGQREIQTLKMELAEIMKGSFAHFMLKEIFEQPESLINTMRGRINFDNYEVTLGGIKDHLNTIKQANRLILIACGTSYNSAIATRKILEELCDIPVSVELSSDFLDRTPPIYRNDVCIFISQSGETADTIKALQYCKSKGSLSVGVTNTVGSSLARGTDCGVHINAGSEIGVASTKAYTSQVVTLLMFGLLLSRDSISKQQRRIEIIDSLKRLSSDVANLLKTINEQIKDIAKELTIASNLIVLGRGWQHATCIEAALKIKELAYLHTEGILIGELKHGPLSLIDENMPVLIIATKDQFDTSVINGINQVLSRNAKPILLITEGDSTMASMAYKYIEVPATADCVQPIINIIPMQLLAYYTAVFKGCNVDQPRNLAKSVTVV